MLVCVLGSGSSGNATYVASETTRLLVDCGLPARDIIDRLAELDVGPATLNAILITHAHTDHYKSSGTMQARFGVKVFTEPLTLATIRAAGSPCSFGRVTSCKGVPRKIGDIEVDTFPVPHGAPGAAGQPVGYVLKHGREKVTVTTDLGRVSEGTARALKGSDIIVIEANYHEPILRKKLKDTRYRMFWPYLKWVDSNMGHLSNTQCGTALADIMTERTGHVFPAHISENHEDPDQDNNRYDLAYSEIRAILKDRDVPMPKIHRTYRNGKIEGRMSEAVSV